MLQEGHPNQLKVRSLLHRLLSLNIIYQGGKRPYHTIIPAMALRGDELFLSFGVMGGFMQVNRIISGFTLQHILYAGLASRSCSGPSQPFARLDSPSGSRCPAFLYICSYSRL